VESLSTDEKTLGGKLKKYTFNFIKYLLVIAISAILVIPVLLVVLFRVIILNKNEIDVLPSMLKIFKSNKGKDSNYDKMFDEVDLLNNVESK
jgi:general stress protein CsbA